MKKNTFAFLMAFLLASCNQTSIIDSNGKEIVPSDNTPSQIDNPIENSISNTDNNETSSSEIEKQNFDISKYIDFAYQPTFDSFSEVSYYSLLSTKMEKNQKSSSQLRKRKNSKKEESEDSNIYYPIEGMLFEFSNFLYFKFQAEENSFLEEKVGLGEISCLIVDFVERIIVFKNNDKYYSCVENGALNHYEYGEQNCYLKFSSHKYFKDFNLVKEMGVGTCGITVNFGQYDLNYEELSSISFSSSTCNETHNIDPESIYHEDISLLCSRNELRQMFGLEVIPDDEYTKLDDYKLKLTSRLGSFNQDIPTNVRSVVNRLIWSANSKEEVDQLFYSYFDFDEKFTFYKLWSLYAPIDQVDEFNARVSSCATIDELIEIDEEYKHVNDDFDFGQYKLDIDEIVEQLNDENCYLFKNEIDSIAQFKEFVSSLDFETEKSIFDYFDALNELFESFAEDDVLIPCQISCYNQILNDEQFVLKYMKDYLLIEKTINISWKLNRRKLMKQMLDYYLENTEELVPSNINERDKDLAYEMIGQYNYLKYEDQGEVQESE